MKILSILCFSLICFYNANSQIKVSNELASRLTGKTRFYEIKETVEAYYSEQKEALASTDSLKIKKIERERKKWNRYFYESESRLNSEGEVENAAQKTFDYLYANNLQDGTSNSLSANGIWTLIGPTNVSSGIGRINRIAFHPSDAQTMYAGSAGGGLFKTTTGGAAWSNIASFIPSLGVSGIVVSYANANVIYVLTGDGDGFNSGGFTYRYGYIRYSVGVLKSTDGGQTFSPTGDLPGATGTNYVGFKLVQDPNNPNTIFATTNRGIYKTADGGISWAHVVFKNGSGGVISSTRRVYDIEFKPGNSQIIYCTARDDQGDCQFFKSTNYGDEFQEKSISPSFTNANRIEIGVTPANSSYVYLLAGPGYYEFGNNSDDHFKGLYRSTDSGDNFDLRSNSPDILGYDDILNTFAHQSDYDLALAVSPTNANTIISGGLVAWRSNDGGVTWSEIVDYFQDIDNSNYIHPDIHDLQFNPLNNKLISATDGGVSISDDNGDNWNQLFNGLSCTQFYHFEPYNEDGNIWGGAQDNGTLERNGNSSTFNNFDSGDGYDVLTDKSPAGNYNDRYWVVNKEIWADGIVDVNVTPDGSNEFFPNLAMSPTNEDVIYAGYKKLFISYDRGDNWTDFPFGSGFTPGNWSLSTCPTNRKRIYAAGENSVNSGLYRVDELDDTAPDVVTNLTVALNAAGYPASHPKITDIAVSENGSNIVWVTVGGYESGQKVFFSSNAGTSWTNISGNLPNLPVHTIIADYNDNVYIGTDIGVYFRGVNNTDWSPFYNGLPRVAVSELDMLYDPNAQEYKIYAATYGRGIWVSDVAGSCPPTLNITSTQQGQKFYQAGSVINSTSIVNGIAGTNVAFRSAGEINLTPGFNAIPGVNFKAYIGDCYSGLPVFKTIFDSTGTEKIYINKIDSFKSIGFINHAEISDKNVSIDIEVKDIGNYWIKLFDNESKRHITSVSIICPSTSQKNILIEVPDKQHSFLRADLFKDDNLVFMQDVKIK